MDRSLTSRRILFVCAGNTCRSPMAAALAQEAFGGAVRAESAGLDADDGSWPTKDAVQAMEERGLDIRGHRSRPLEVVRLEDFDVLVALTPAIGDALRRAGVEPGRIRTLDIPDPYNEGPDSYRRAAAAIDRGLGELLSPEVGAETAVHDDLVAYVSGALSRVENGGVSSPSGSWLSGIFGRAARMLEKRVSLHVKGMLASMHLRYPEDLGDAVQGSPPYDRLTLGQLAAVTRAAARREPSAPSEQIPGGQVECFVKQIASVNRLWVDVKHGEEADSAALVSALRTILELAERMKNQG